MTVSDLRIADQGYFWVGIDFEQRQGQTVPDGTQLYVEYQIPARQTQPYPVVLIHGGGGQSLDWISTPDGRPGWRSLLLERGYAVYLVDRPGHGRSPRTFAEREVDSAAGMIPSVEALGPLFAGHGDPLHTQWPGSGEGVADQALSQLLASQRQVPFDVQADHALMRRNGAALLERIGPAVIITSSAGGPSGWQMADARPELVRAVIALEPLGPGGPIPLAYGISSAHLGFEPELGPTEELNLESVPGDGGAHLYLQGEPVRRLPNLAEIPVAVVTAERSFANAGGGDANTVAFLRQAGGRRVDHLLLPEMGIRGNGHLMMIERNNEAVLDAVLAWLDARVGAGSADAAAAGAATSS